MSLTISRRFPDALPLCWYTENGKPCQAWLDLDPSHKAFIYCSNGKTKTAIVMACMLRYFEVVRAINQIFKLTCFVLGRRRAGVTALPADPMVVVS